MSLNERRNLLKFGEISLNKCVIFLQMAPIIIATLLLLLNPIISFWKDKSNITRDGKGRSAWVIPVAFLCVGILSAGLSFYNSKSSLDAKILSDSAANLIQHKYDSLNQRQIDFLGGGPAKPLFGFAAMSSSLFVFFMIDTAPYPMRDIRISIQDELSYASYKDKFKGASNDSNINKRDLSIYLMQGYSQYGREVKLPFITSQDYNALYTQDIGASTHLKYTVSVIWSNGSLAYYIETFKVNGSWRETRTCYDRIKHLPVTE